MTNREVLDQAFARVGTTTGKVLEVLGDLAASGTAYLVGSLAVGLGNAGSDIDIQVLSEEPPAGDVPAVFFVRQTILEVQYLSRDAPHVLVEDLSGDIAETPYGKCLLGPAPPNRYQKRLSRWLTAVALGESDVLLDDEEAERACSALVRGAVEQFVKAVWLAKCVDSAMPLVSKFAWRRAARWAVEAWVRGHGDVFVSDKWMAAKALRSADHALVECLTATDGRSVAELATHIGLLDLTIDHLIRQEAAPDIREIALGGDDWVVGDAALCKLQDGLNILDRDAALYASLALCSEPAAVEVDHASLNAVIAASATRRPA